VAQFVPLKVETVGEQWQQWARKYDAEGEGIPKIYIVRADGEQIYGKSGAITGDRLPEFMEEQLATAGRVFPVKSARKLRALVDSAKEDYENGDLLAAVKSIERLGGVGKLGDLGSLAQPAIDADEFANQLIAEGRATLKAADEGLAASSDDFEAAVKLASATRIYANLLKLEVAEVLKKYRRNREVQDMLKQAEVVDRATIKVKQRNGRNLAIDSLKNVMARNPNSPAYDYIVDHFEEITGVPLDGDLAAAGGSDDSDSYASESNSDAGDDDVDLFGGPAAAQLGMRIWTTRSGKSSVEAEFVEIVGKKVRLRKKNGKITTISIKALSDEDRELLGEE